MVALLAAEKRPGTTEWEKHADHLSKTRKMNEFKGGGKFRRFGPPTQPANYPTKPIENLRRTLLEDDSCYSDAYYNSNSSPQHSTASDSPRLRRARLPTNGVLAANAKRMQREFATFVSNRRNVTSALRHTVLPAISRHFDYNPQRPCISSPTPSVIGYTRSGYSTPVMMHPELLPNQRSASWKRGASSSRLHSPPSHMGRVLPRVIAPLDPQLAANVISQSKLKSTKAFASLRGDTNGRSRIFGQTRSGSPVNRRVFARRSGSPPASKGRVPYVRSGSPERIRALIQDKVERKTKVKPLTETPTKIRLERKASVKGSKEVDTKELPTNGFSLAKALSPIKIAAETHSLPHLKSDEKRTTFVAHSLMEVVEQAVERAKNGGDISDSKDGKENAQNEEALKIKKETPVKDERQKETPTKSPNTVKKNGGKRSANGKDAENEKSPNKDPIKRGSKSNMWLENKDTSNSNASSIRSKKPVPSPVRRNSKSSSTIGSKGSNNVTKLTSQPSTSRQKSSPSQNTEKDAQIENLAISGRFSTSPNKKSPAHHETHNLWANTGPERKDISSSHNRTLETKLSTKGGSTQSLGKVGRTSPNLKRRENGGNSLTENRSPINNTVRANSSRGNHISQESKTVNNNDRYSNKNNWNSSSRRNSKEQYTNISNRFEYNATLSSLPREKNRSPRKYNTSSPYHEKQGPEEVEKINYVLQMNGEANNSVKNATGDESLRGTQFNLNFANKGFHDERSSLLSKENLSNIENMKYRSEGIHGPQREIHLNSPRTSKNSPVTKPINSHEQNNNEHKSNHITNHIHNLTETLKANDNLSTNQMNYEENVQNEKTPTHQFTKSPIKQTKNTTVYSPSHNSHNSSPSKSSKSSSSIVIRTNLSTPETEDYDEEVLNRELSQELEQLKLYDSETRDERNFSQHASIEEDSQTDLEEYSRTDHEESSRTDYEEALHTDADVSSRTDVDNYSAASSSSEDLINTLSPQTAYLNLGRSATMLPLKPKPSILKPPTSLFHSPSHTSSSYRRYSSSYESDQLEKVLFIGELSSVARSRSACVLSPTEKIDRCDVCHNTYVIK
ncbi:homeobox protein 2 isoform X2 [Bactrocera dorsalis]|nr:homeobox protein 2 isoform X2 [Bactrocera dorsalis]